MPEGRFTETVFSAQGELERAQHVRQVVRKMPARAEQGYWQHKPPVDYRPGTHPVHGKLMERDEPVASIVTEALEGFASGRFASQSEVLRFLQSKPEFPKSKSGKMRPASVKNMLSRVIYTGYISVPGFGVGLQTGHHEPLISFETHERILARLSALESRVETLERQKTVLAEQAERSASERGHLNEQALGIYANY